jgi:hypothetical protein
MQSVSELVERAKASHRFREFGAVFKGLGARSWLDPDEMALFYSIGAFFEGDGINVEIGTFEGASALFTAAGLRSRRGGSGASFIADAIGLDEPAHCGSVRRSR